MDFPQGIAVPQGIALARIRRFQLLRELFGEINIPLAVYDEVVNAGKGRAGVIEVESADWIHYHQVSNSDLVAFLRISLDAVKPRQLHWLRYPAALLSRSSYEF